LKTFLSIVLFASITGFLISILPAPAYRSNAIHSSKLSFVKSESSLLHNNVFRIDCDLAADDDDADESVQPRLTDNASLTHFILFPLNATGTQEKIIPDASHCILIHCLKI
jgi:hypothetical protein